MKELNPNIRFAIAGKVQRVAGFMVEATGVKAQIGSLCRIQTQHDDVIAEIIGFHADTVYLMTPHDLRGITPGCPIYPLQDFPKVPVGPGLLGRIIDGDGNPLDNSGPLTQVEEKLLRFDSINPLSRSLIKQPFDVGVKVINSLFTLGQGQRVGLFSGSGVGKSVLLGMIAKFAKSDVNVISLVGERGREVREFIEENIGEVALKKSVIIASPADCSPLSRIKAADTATFIAEYFRNHNKHVLLLMDSITRYAHALRELGLALGEPPTQKGYPPSVFAKIPKLIERAGNGNNPSSSITAIYTVLADGDDIHDPIVDCARGILDGHIVLSRKLAEEGHYPAVCLEQSISRVMDKVISPEHMKQARSFKRAFSKYQQNKDYITLGAYQKGFDLELDKVLEKKNEMWAFLQQESSQNIDLSQSVALLQHLNL